MSTTSFEPQNEELTAYQQEKIKLQKETNKRLKDIDTTLDWFFWLMIFGIIIYVAVILLGAASAF